MIYRFLIAIWLTFSVTSAARAEVVVFAAASLKEPLDTLAATFGDVVVSYGGSGTLARQVSLGAPADIVILANVDWMDFLVDRGQVRPQSLRELARNRLVLIGLAGMDDVSLDASGIAVALGNGRIAVGLTQAVPAGIYAKGALVSLDLWNDFSDTLAEVDNVRSALALVARGQAPLGIVYQTDARVSDDVRIVAQFPETSHPPIRYLAAFTTDASDEAEAFLQLVAGPRGQSVFADAGFLPPLEIAQ